MEVTLAGGLCAFPWGRGLSASHTCEHCVEFWLETCWPAFGWTPPRWVLAVWAVVHGCVSEACFHLFPLGFVLSTPGCLGIGFTSISFCVLRPHPAPCSGSAPVREAGSASLCRAQPGGTSPGRPLTLWSVHRAAGISGAEGRRQGAVDKWQKRRSWKGGRAPAPSRAKGDAVGYRAATTSRPWTPRCSSGVIQSDFLLKFNFKRREKPKCVQTSLTLHPDFQHLRVSHGHEASLLSTFLQNSSASYTVAV